VRKKVVEITNLKKGKVLDVCSGTGKQAFAFAEKGFEVTGIDLSEEMINIAKRKSKKYENVKFFVCDASELDFRKNHFDISVISFGLHEMPEEIRDNTLTEMKRVTKKQIIIIDFSTEKTSWFIKLFESKYYHSFLQTPIEELLERNKIKIKEKHEILWGYANILKCK